METERIHRWLDRVAPVAVGALVPLSYAFSRTWQVVEGPRWLWRRRQLRRVTEAPPASLRTGQGSVAEALGELRLDTMKPRPISGMDATSIMGMFELAPMFLNTGRRTRNLAYPYPSAFHETVIPGDRGMPLSGIVGMHHAKTRRPALLVVHGYLHSRTNDTVRALMLRAWHDWGFHVVACDLRGFGRTAQFSSTPASGGAIEARDLAAVARYMKGFRNVTSVGVLGISLGGATALLAATSEEAARDRLFDGGVIAVGPPWELGRVLRRFDEPTDDPEWMFTQSVFRYLFRRGVRNSELRRWFRKKVQDREGVDLAEAERSLIRFMELFVAEGYLARRPGEHHLPSARVMARLLQLSSPLLRLDRIRCPTLVLSAKDDPIVRLDADLLDKIHKRSAGNPLFHLHTTDRGGHCGYPVVAPAWYYRVLRTWFSYWADWRAEKVHPFGE